jgi:hypothetical protein
MVTSPNLRGLVERNRIFDNFADARHTIAGLLASLPPGERSDFLGLPGVSGANSDFLCALQTVGEESDPILGVILETSKLEGYLEGRNPRPRHGRKPDTTYPVTPLRYCGETLSFKASKPGYLACGLAEIRWVSRTHGATRVFESKED